MKPPLVAALDNDQSISRCTRHRGSFWISALSSNAGIEHEDSCATAPRTDITWARQVTGIDARIDVTQQVNDDVAPDLLYLFLFKEPVSPGVVFDVGPDAGGDVDMRVMIELPAAGEPGPVAEGVVMFIRGLAPAIVMVEQPLCESRNIHCADYRGWQGMGKEPRLQTSHVTDVLVSCRCQPAPHLNARQGLKDG